MSSQKAKQTPAVSPNQMRGSIFESSFRTMGGSAVSAFRPAAMEMRTLALSQKPSVSEDFLEASKVNRADHEFRASCSYFYEDPLVIATALTAREILPGDPITLPKSDRLYMELGEAIARRRSNRHFSGSPLGLGQLAALVRSAAGVTISTPGAHPAVAGLPIQFRSCPSAGGLYPVDLYIVAKNCTGLTSAVYLYDWRQDVLRTVNSDKPLSAVMDAFSDRHDESIQLSKSSVVFLLVGRPQRVLRKYGDRGCRMMLIEAGCIAQTIHLAASALGLGSVDCSAVFDDEVHAALSLTGRFDILLHTIVIGQLD